MEQFYTVTKYHQIYLAHKKDTTNKAFYDEYKSQIIFYQNILAKLKKSYTKLTNSKDIFKELDSLHEKRIPYCKSILHQSLIRKICFKSEKL